MSTGVFELTSFQRDILYVVEGLEKPSGQDIKDELEEQYGSVTHGRLYPNLDSLVDQGYLEKGELDRRTNYYEITGEGRTAIEDRREWENEQVDLGS